MQDLPYRADPTQETCARDYADIVRPTRQHGARSYILYISYRSSSLKGLCQIDDLSIYLFVRDVKVCESDKPPGLFLIALFLSKLLLCPTRMLEKEPCREPRCSAIRGSVGTCGSLYFMLCWFVFFFCTNKDSDNNNNHKNYTSTRM